MKLLIKKGASVNVQDCNGWTALHSCARNGFLDGLQLLLAWWTTSLSMIASTHRFLYLLLLLSFCTLCNALKWLGRPSCIPNSFCLSISSSDACCVICAYTSWSPNIDVTCVTQDGTTAFVYLIRRAFDKNEREQQLVLIRTMIGISRINRLCPCFLSFSLSPSLYFRTCDTNISLPRSFARSLVLSMEALSLSLSLYIYLWNSGLSVFSFLYMIL